MIRRGQDSNLQSSGHEPDELTNSSTPLLPLLFLSLFPPRAGGIEPALSKLRSKDPGWGYEAYLIIRKSRKDFFISAF